MKSFLALSVALALVACAGPTAEVTVAEIPPAPPAPVETAAPSASASALASDKAAEIAAELKKENAAVSDVLDQGSGAKPDVPGPSVRVLAATSTSQIGNMAQVIAGLRPSFMRCFNNALKRDPTITGAVTLDAKIGPGGEVLNVKLRDVKGLNTEVSTCISGALRSVKFQAPQGGAATLTLPLNLSAK